MPRDVQTIVAKQIKEAAEKGVRICTASVPHRSDDVVRGNPELRGRVLAINFDYWKPNEILQIAQQGFAALNVSIPEAALKRINEEAFGSPQLMQAICLQTCRYLRVDKQANVLSAHSLESNDLQKIFEYTSSWTDFSSLLDKLHSGPKPRGLERNQYDLKDRSKGDVYRAVLLALRDDPLSLSFDYDAMYRRTRAVCVGDMPTGSSIAQALDQMSNIAADLQPTSRVIEWSDEVLGSVST